jgi:L,D-transpeptidase ErfK/SrfK
LPALKRKEGDASLSFLGRKGSVLFFIGLLAGGALSSCSVVNPPVRSGAPVEQDPLPTTRFTLQDPAANVVGSLQVIRSREADTFIDIAQAYHVGYDELVEANPGIDPWLPGQDTAIVLPTRFVLPDAPRQGIVLNVASKRLFYFPPAEPGAPPVVHTFPISIGVEGWATPLGTTKVTSKKKDPEWRVPASIRKEHAEKGDPLPAVVPPGPDNPLGAYAMRLAIPGDYLIHGTNKPAGVGMRTSHGCIRMNPDDIEWLYPQVPVGLPVHIVNQPVLIGIAGGDLYLEAHAALEEDKTRRIAAMLKTIEKSFGSLPKGARIDYERVAQISTQKRGIPVSIIAGGLDLEAAVSAAPRVTNIVTYDWFANREPEQDASPPATAAQAKRPAAGQ